MSISTLILETQTTHLAIVFANAYSGCHSDAVQDLSQGVGASVCPQVST
ncbi:hypothetical protein LC613_00605 [Nostoc sphaeroides CHAB 2801]|nr:hypothetical protein [Nostoc sphaeroides]MCC5626772.1 hypothetical protein [Nostoc sphaeroides CHAB 2801]